VLCRLAYLDAGPERDAGLAQAGFRQVADFRRSDETADTRGFLAEREDFDVLAFRGTDPDSARNWITDFDAAARDLGDGVSVHAGFDAAYELVRADVSGALARRGDRPLFVAGHSLGGALAVLACFRLAPELGERLAACYTFGCPRVGNVEFLTRIYKVALYQAVNGDDVVPHLPPRLLSRFCDSGDVRHLLLGAEVRAVKGWGENLLQRLRSALGRALLALVFRFSFLRGAVLFVSPAALIDDHSIKLYAENLRLVALRNNPDAGAAA